MAHYRLRVVDRSGKASISQTVLVRYQRATAATIAIYPSPFSTSLSIQTQGLFAGMIDIQVLDLRGKLIRNTKFDLSHASNIQLSGFATLPAGSYVVRYQHPALSGQSLVIKQ